MTTYTETRHNFMYRPHARDYICSFCGRIIFSVKDGGTASRCDGRRKRTEHDERVPTGWFKVGDAAND